MYRYTRRETGIISAAFCLCIVTLAGRLRSSLPRFVCVSLHSQGDWDHLCRVLSVYCYTRRETGIISVALCLCIVTLAGRLGSSLSRFVCVLLHSQGDWDHLCRALSVYRSTHRETEIISAALCLCILTLAGRLGSSLPRFVCVLLHSQGDWDHLCRALSVYCYTRRETGIISVALCLCIVTLAGRLRLSLPRFVCVLLHSQGD